MKQHLLFLFLIGLSFAATAAGKKHKSAHRAVHHKKHHNDVMARVQVEYTPADKVMADSIGIAASPDQLLTYAQKLIGTPYHFATSNPGYGFDCSGFVGFVFKSFNFDVPRSSCEYINIGEKLALNEAKPGDIILFTGTQTRSRKIGHIG